MEFFEVPCRGVRSIFCSFLHVFQTLRRVNLRYSLKQNHVLYLHKCMGKFMLTKTIVLLCSDSSQEGEILFWFVCKDRSPVGKYKQHC